MVKKKSKKASKKPTKPKKPIMGEKSTKLSWERSSEVSSSNAPESKQWMSKKVGDWIF